MYHIHDTFNKMHSTARAPRHDIARLLHAKLADAANTTRGRGSGFIADDENLKTTITRLQQNHLNLKCYTHPTSSLSRFHCKGSHIPAGWRQSSPKLAKITKKCRRTRSSEEERNVRSNARPERAFALVLDSKAETRLRASSGSARLRAIRSVSLAPRERGSASKRRRDARRKDERSMYHERNARRRVGGSRR